MTLTNKYVGEVKHKINISLKGEEEDVFSYQRRSYKEDNIDQLKSKFSRDII